MPCARLIRGTSSSENAVTPRAASASTTAPCVAGWRKLIVAAPLRSAGTSSTAGGCTPSNTSAAPRSAALSVSIAAPASR